MQLAAEAVAKQAKGEVEGLHPYLCEQGDPQFGVVRVQTPEGKTFRVITPVDDRWKAGGLTRDLLPVYRLPRVVESEVVVVCEGEKCVDHIEELGITATTSALGANSAAKTNWDSLSNKRVYLTCDNDAPGRSYGEDVVRLLRVSEPHADIRKLELPGLDHGEDVADWIKAQTSEGLAQDEIAAALCSLMDAAERWPEHGDESEPRCSRSQLRVRLRSRAEILRLPGPRFLVKGYLTRGSTVILGADPNLGKSTLANAWAHCAWTGTPWLGHRTSPGSVLFVLGEDVRGASLRARSWEAEHGAIGDVDGRYVEYADRMPPLCDADGQDELRGLLQFLEREHGHAPAMVIVDTLSTVWGSEPENAAELAAGFMSALSALADEFGCTFLLIHHLSKPSPSRKKGGINLSSIRGASAFVGGVDDVLVLEEVETGVARLYGIKARNSDKAPGVLLRVHKVSLGTNNDGDEVTSVVMQECFEDAESEAAREDAERRTKWDAAEKLVQRALDTLREMGSARNPSSLVARMTGKRSDCYAAVNVALDRELIVDEGTKMAPKLVVADDKGGGSKTPHTPEEGTGNRSSAGAGPDPVPCDEGTGSPDEGTGNRTDHGGSTKEGT